MRPLIGRSNFGATLLYPGNGELKSFLLHTSRRDGKGTGARFVYVPAGPVLKLQPSLVVGRSPIGKLELAHFFSIARSSDQNWVR